MLHKFKKSKLQFPTFILGDFWVILKPTKLPKLSTGLVGWPSKSETAFALTSISLSLRLSNIIWKWLESKSTVVSPAPPGLVDPVSCVLCPENPEKLCAIVVQNSFYYFHFYFYHSHFLQIWHFISFNSTKMMTIHFWEKRAYRTINNDNIIMLFKFSFTST